MATEICEAEKKKTIQPTHVMQALERLGLAQYNAELKSVANASKTQRKETNARKKRRKDLTARNGMSTEELVALQKAMLEKAKQQGNL